jgi:hypothetical protein
MQADYAILRVIYNITFHFTNFSGPLKILIFTVDGGPVELISQTTSGPQSILENHCLRD